jgi:pullulanase
MKACTTTEKQNNDDANIPLEDNLWLEYSSTSTIFKLWSPLAEEVKLNLYATGNDSPSTGEYNLLKNAKGVWKRKLAVI